MNENEISYTLEKTPPSRPGFVRGLLRLVLALLAGILLGAGLYYFGSVYLYWQAIQPAQSSAARLNVMETSIAIDKQQSDERLSQFNQRLTELEKRNTLNSESLAGLQSSLNSLSKEVGDHSTTLKSLDKIKGDLEKLGQQTASNEKNLGDLQTTLQAEDAPLAVLSRELSVLKAMELLSRSRLYLIQNNAGLAGQDLESARVVIEGMIEEVPEAQKETVSLWVKRIDLAQANIKDAPIVAANDIDIAWGLLATGFSLPQQIPTLQAAGTLTSEIAAPTSTPSPVTASPTPTQKP